MDILSGFSFDSSISYLHFTPFWIQTITDLYTSRLCIQTLVGVCTRSPEKSVKLVPIHQNDESAMRKKLHRVQNTFKGHSTVMGPKMGKLFFTFYGSIWSQECAGKLAGSNSI